MKMDEFKDVKQGVVLAGFLPYLEAEVAGMVKSLENRVFTGITAGTLTAEQALNAWMERHALRKLLVNFEQKIKASQTVAAVNAKSLDYHA